MYADMHIHSIYSDSLRSPEEVVRTAKERNVGLLSVCDHFSINAYPRLISACEEASVAYTYGVELGASLGDDSFDVLEYNFDHDNVRFKELINKQKEINIEYKTRML